MADQPNPVVTTADGICATVGGNALELIETGEGRLEALLELIDSAQSSIRMLFYIFRPDHSGERVRDALVAAARRGVEVKLLLDGYGCSDASPSFFEPLSHQGGSFCLVHPSYVRRYLLRNHQKLVVADDSIALIGGANVHDDYLVDEGPRHWRDLWLRIEGPSVRRAADYFDDVYRWTTKKGAKLRTLRRLVNRHSDHRGPLQWKFSGPLSRRNPWPTDFVQDMAEAHKLDIISAYFSPPRALLRRVARLATRGRVRIITAAKSDNNATIAAARHNYWRMLRRGVEMYEYQAARLHTKLLILDDVVYIGSANFDFRSIYINLEIMLRVQDRAFADAMRGYFERELAGSEQITPELHRKRATWLNRLKWMISHWLVTSMDYTVTRRLNFGPEM
jgi:cardiolipin synthase